MASEEKPSGDVPDRPIDDFSNKIDIQPTFEPPSPLTGCYLLIILGEPHSQEHKDIILQRLLKGNFPLFVMTSFRLENVAKLTFKIRQSFCCHKLSASL